MYSLTIHFGPNAMVWQFLFKDKESAAAQSAFRVISTQGDTHFSIADDYGQHGHFASASVHGWLFEDLEAGEEARILRSLSSARAQQRLQKRAATDPELSQMIRGQGGPSVLTPFSNGRFS